MRRIWSWYRSRRWWVKTLVAIPTALVAVAALYILARALQYRAASDAGVGEFVPEGAQVTLRLNEAARHWERLQSGELWKVVQRKMMRDRAFRKNVNDLLKEADLPTLDQLQDPRFLDSATDGFLTESNVMRFAGRDAMVALRLGSSPNDLRWCAATRVGFGDYLLLPFAPLALKKIDVGGTPCLQAGDLTVAILGAVAVASNDRTMLASALKRRGPKEAPKKPIEGSISFEGSPVLQEARRHLNGFPAGAFFVFADGESLSRVRFALDVDGADVVLDARLDGMKTVGPDAVPADAARYVPAAGSGAVVFNVGGDSLWQWGQKIAQAPARTELDRLGQSILREAVQILMDGQFPTRVPAQIQGPMSVVLGSATGAGQRTFTSCAFVFRSDNPTAAEEGLRGVVQDLLRGAEDKIGLSNQSIHGRTVWSLDLGPDPFRLQDYLRPCWVAFNDALVVANNLDFLISVVNVAYGGAPTMVDEPFYQSAMHRLDRLWLKRVLRDGTVSTGFLYGPAFHEGLEGFWPIVADKLTDNDASRQRLRAQLEKEYRESGRNPLGPDFVREFNAAMKDQTAQTEQDVRERARSLSYLHWAAFEILSEEGGLRLRAAVELK